MLWEAQFGDFVNGAQVDHRPVPRRPGSSKWGVTTRLTLLLPHGYEGQGPEHSSARLERFLQPCAEGNMRVANPTTPAQYFHLLRRQAKRTRQRPLVIMTPKSLLRHPLATRTLDELARRPLAAGDRRPDGRGRGATRSRRVVLCSGKVYYDLLAEARQAARAARRAGAGRAALLVPVGGAAGAAGAVPEPAGAGVGAGGAAQHGRVDVPGAEAARAAAERGRRSATRAGPTARARRRAIRRRTRMEQARIVGDAITVGGLGAPTG